MLQAEKAKVQELELLLEYRDAQFEKSEAMVAKLNNQNNALKVDVDRLSGQVSESLQLLSEQDLMIEKQERLIYIMK